MKLKTSKNFDLTMSILKNQLGYSDAMAYRVTMFLYNEIKKYRVDGKYTRTIDDFLVRMPHLDTLELELHDLLLEAQHNGECVVLWVENNWDYAFDNSHFKK